MMKAQASRLHDVDGQVFDVVVIGGGIIGASAAREAAREGYSVLLAEKSDFATGASSRSSRLLHCGLRYFETPKPFRTFAAHPARLFTAVRMARQAMRCRHEFVKTAPQRVTPIEMMFPIYRNSHYLPWQVDLGFRVLQNLAPRDVPLNYRRLTRDEALAHPMGARLSNKENLHSAAIFTEYQFVWPERICVDAVLDAEEMGAVALNHTEAVLADAEGEIRSVALRHKDGGSATVGARRVLVMAGAWIDRVLKQAHPDMPRKILGTKGAHIVVKLPDDLRGKGVATVNGMEEPFYCIPQGDLHYIGPTETVYEGDPDMIRCDGDDIRFILSEAAKLFPGFGLDHADIIRTWAGVRPLTYDESQPKGARSRELHDLSGDGLPGVFAMTAGPIMTHRDAGREVAARLRKDIAPSRPAHDPLYRVRLPVSDPATPRVIEAESGYHLEDVRRAVTGEHAASLADVLYRRAGLGWRHFLTREELEPVAAILAEELGWDAERREAEITGFIDENARLFGVPGI